MSRNESAVSLPVHQDATVDFARLFLTDLSADLTGEMLRDLTFPGEGIGCYSTFDVREGAVEWVAQSREVFWTRLDLWGPDDRGEGIKDAVELGKGYTYTIGPVVIDVCWFWDGDGCLAFRVRGPGFQRTLINHDCKKDYRWEDLGDRRG